MVDLSTLPPPNVIEALDFETILSERKASFQARWATVRANNPGLDLPDYDVLMLETDPVVVLLEEESARELNLRARGNDIGRAQILEFATGLDLDYLASFYDVIRLDGETDARLKARVTLEIRARSPGGTEVRYQAIAMAASVKVEQAKVYTIGKSPIIHVAIFSTETNGVASAELLQTVNAALQNPAAKMVNDTIVVESAILTVVNIQADYWLLDGVPESTAIDMAANLRAEWGKVQAMGRDLVVKWWTSKLMIAGVYEVEETTPLATVVASPYEALAIGTVTLNFRGRAF